MVDWYATSALNTETVTCSSPSRCPGYDETAVSSYPGTRDSGGGGGGRGLDTTRRFGGVSWHEWGVYKSAWIADAGGSVDLWTVVRRMNVANGFGWPRRKKKTGSFGCLVVLLVSDFAGER